MDHDAAHKYLYMLDDVVADLLRLVVPGWVDDLDLAAIENVSTEYLDDACQRQGHRKRLGDMVWKVYFRNGALANGHRPYILVLVEFQSTADRDMARRIHEYTDLLLDRLVRNGVMAREGTRAAVALALRVPVGVLFPSPVLDRPRRTVSAELIETAGDQRSLRALASSRTDRLELDRLAGHWSLPSQCR